jgi:hypothetical protein
MSQSKKNRLNQNPLKLLYSNNESKPQFFFALAGKANNKYHKIFSNFWCYLGISLNAFGERCRCATASSSIFFFFFFFVVLQRTRQVGVGLRLLLNVPWRIRHVDDGQVA